MGKKNKLYSVVQIKSDKFRGTVREPCGTKRIRNSGIQRALLEELEELLQNAKSDIRAFRGTKAGKSAYFTHPDFSATKLGKKKCANCASKYGIHIIPVFVSTHKVQFTYHSFIHLLAVASVKLIIKCSASPRP
jgi:hypothetical protein